MPASTEAATQAEPAGSAPTAGMPREIAQRMPLDANAPTPSCTHDEVDRRTGRGEGFGRLGEQRAVALDHPLADRRVVAQVAVVDRPRRGVAAASRIESTTAAS